MLYPLGENQSQAKHAENITTLIAAGNFPHKAHTGCV